MTVAPTSIKPRRWTTKEVSWDFYILKMNSHKILPIGENDAAKLSLGQQLQFFTRFLLSIKEMGGVSHTKRQLKYKI